MAVPAGKRYREDSFASDNEFSEDSVGIFPSENESDDDDDTRECFFPSEESNQANMDSHTINLSDSSLSQQEMPETEEIGEEMVRIGKILVSTCCENFCLRRLTAMDVIASKAEQSQCKNRSECTDWLFTKLRENSSETNKGDLQTRYFVAGKEICSSAWCKLFSVSHRTLQRMQSKLTFEDGIQHGNSTCSQVHHSQSLATICERLRSTEFCIPEMNSKYPLNASENTSEIVHSTKTNSSIIDQLTVQNAKPLSEDSQHECYDRDTSNFAPAIAYDLLEKCLDLNPHVRITAHQALQHPFLSS